MYNSTLSSVGFKLLNFDEINIHIEVHNVLDWAVVWGVGSQVNRFWVLKKLPLNYQQTQNGTWPTNKTQLKIEVLYTLGFAKPKWVPLYSDW